MSDLLTGAMEAAELGRRYSRRHSRNSCVGGTICWHSWEAAWAWRHLNHPWACRVAVGRWLGHNDRRVLRGLSLVRVFWRRTGSRAEVDLPVFTTLWCMAPGFAAFRAGGIARSCVDFMTFQAQDGPQLRQKSALPISASLHYFVLVIILESKVILMKIVIARIWPPVPVSQAITCPRPSSTQGFVFTKLLPINMYSDGIDLCFRHAYNLTSTRDAPF